MPKKLTDQMLDDFKKYMTEDGFNNFKELVYKDIEQYQSEIEHIIKVYYANDKSKGIKEIRYYFKDGNNSFDYDLPDYALEAARCGVESL